jgi:lysozyme
MTVCQEAIDLICSFEGYHRALPDGRAAPYRDPVGIPTIGFGSIWRPDGTRVEMADAPITRVQALARMGDEVSRKCESAVARYITVDLHPLMHGALVSWTYNLGAGALAASTLRRMINARDWGRVPAEFAKWRMAKGVILSGLVRRRAAEAAMFMRGVRTLAEDLEPEASLPPADPDTGPPAELISTTWSTMLHRLAAPAPRRIPLGTERGTA